MAPNGSEASANKGMCTQLPILWGLDFRLRLWPAGRLATSTISAILGGHTPYPTITGERVCPVLTNLTSPATTLIQLPCGKAIPHGLTKALTACNKL